MRKRNYIKRVSRGDRRFRGRAITVTGVSHNEVNTTVISVLDKLIICDACNDEIKDEQINILVVGGHEWGALCEECRLRYHKKLPILRG